MSYRLGHFHKVALQHFLLRHITPPLIGVGTVGAEGAAAPPIFSQWVQTMDYASPIFGDKSHFILLCINTEVCPLT